MNNTLKTASIVADNHKVEKFKAALNAAGFTEFTVKPLAEKISNIAVKCSADQYQEIYKICQQVEFHFKNAN